MCGGRQRHSGRRQAPPLQPQHRRQQRSLAVRLILHSVARHQVLLGCKVRMQGDGMLSPKHASASNCHNANICATNRSVTRCPVCTLGAGAGPHTAKQLADDDEWLELDDEEEAGVETPLEAQRLQQPLQHRPAAAALVGPALCLHVGYKMAMLEFAAMYTYWTTRRKAGCSTASS